MTRSLRALRRRTLRRRGFTLLEIMVSLLIVTTALVTLQAVITENLERTENSMKRRTARTLARQKLEQAMANPEGATGSGGFDDPMLQDFQWNVQQEQITVGTSGQMIQLTVTVTWLIEQGTAGAQPRATGSVSQDNQGFGDTGQGRFALTTYVPAPAGAPGAAGPATGATGQ